MVAQIYCPNMGMTSRLETQEDISLSCSDPDKNSICIVLEIYQELLKAFYTYCTSLF